MPQPLSRVNPNAQITVSTGSISNAPKLATHAMRVIACWSAIESNIALLLSRLLNADTHTGMAMYMALTGGEAKKSALLAAARKAAPEWQYILLQAVIKATKSSRDSRNDFAHGIWGSSKDLPDCLLLMKPGVVVDHAMMDEKTSLVVINKHKLRKYDRSRIFVYNESDFKNSCNEASDAEIAYGLLFMTMGETNEQARRQLLHLPRVAQAIQRLSQESSPEVQEQLRPPLDGEAPAKGIHPDTWDIAR